MFRRLCFSRARVKAMAASFSSYEKQRQKNIEENRKVLQSLGLLNGGLFSKRRQAGVDPGIDGGRRKHGVKRKRSGNEREPNPGFKGCYTRRWSRRLEGKEPKDYGNLDFELEDADDDDRSIIKRQTRISENSFGSIPGIDVGTTWATRLDCSRDGVHRPTVAGIHGNECEGCYSIALSGGYEDDLDFGLAFTYTGAGGRDLKGTKANPKNLRTAPQSKDQTLARSNLALSRNVENRQPVRVIRGYKLDSPYAPEEGYRYDGLYTVERFWQAIGLSGFMVYKFALKRCENQTPYPWKLNVDDLINGDHENGVFPENELEEGNTENVEAREDGKYAVPLAEQKAGTESSDDKEDDLPEENPAEAKELTSNNAENAEEETNGKPVTEKAVSDSVVKNSHEGNTAALQSKELQASTLPAQNDATQECNQNGAEADQEILKKEPGTNDGNSKRQNGQLNGKSTED